MHYYHHPRNYTNFNNDSFIRSLAEDLVKALKEFNTSSSRDSEQLAFTLRNIVVASLRTNLFVPTFDDYSLRANFGHAMTEALEHNSLATKDMASILVKEVISEHFQNTLSQGVAQVVESYTTKIKSLELILVDVLKLYGATALVSNDPEVRKQAEELLKSHKIDINKLLQDSNP
jgi:hypothetical protein